MLSGILLHVLLAAAAPPRETGLWLLERSERQPAERALLEALRIYTRDMDVPITIRRIPAGVVTLDAQAEFARLQCGSAPNLVAWWMSDNTALRVFDCAANQEERLPTNPSDDLPVTVQTLALKVRGLLADALAARKKAPAPESPKPKALPVVSAAPVKPVSVPAAPPPDVVQAKPAPSKAGRPDRGIEISAGYVLGGRSQLDEWRHGVGLTLGWVFSSVPLAIEIDGGIAGQLSRRASRGTVTSRDLPFAVSFSPRLEWGKWFLSAGVRAGVHFLTVEGRSLDGRYGAIHDSSFAVGTVEQIRYAIRPRFGVNLSFRNEVLLPAQRITLDGQEGLRRGPFEWNLCLGLVARM